MPRLTVTHGQPPRLLVNRRACQGSFREHTGDSAQTEDIDCVIHGTYGGGVSATKDEGLGDGCL